ncbi:site-2 protease family protein [Stratiformator vulcanicus]|uniref:site-2 protease family protein n=1 Tax=Stratiformator vulcanicus TaxID=2527980 RepID=UPI00287765EF|nr:site-2 protease family protein [Stratiformator vulcanicus]
MDILTALDPHSFSALFGAADLFAGLFAELTMGGLGSKAAFLVLAAIGLGLVIFFHELGHFAVAKWCDVRVERFSIGLGPVVWSKKWGETEYAISAVPFGGYVKMLGQDDADPSQLSSEEIAEDPRSYSAKPVWQRMLIISAGVTMNVLTAVLFFAGAFGLGVMRQAPVVGWVQPGSPAWTAGLRLGDVIETINDRDVNAFTDLNRGVALSRDAVNITGTHSDGAEFDYTIVPDLSGTRRFLGVGASADLKVAAIDIEGKPTAMPGSAAADAEPKFESKDQIVRLGDTKVDDFAAYVKYLAANRDQSVEYHVQRKSKSGEDDSTTTVTINVPARPARLLGLMADVNNLTGVIDDSPAQKAGLKPGDRLVRIDGEDVGQGIDPLILPHYFADRAGEEVEVTFTRQVPGGEREERTVMIVPNDRPGWVESGLPKRGVPLDVPAIGIAYHISERVIGVVEGSPADEAGIQNNDHLESISFTRPPGAPEDGLESEVETVKFLDSDNGRDVENYVYAFDTMQKFPNRKVKLTVRRENKLIDFEIEPSTTLENGWHLPMRGLALYPLVQELQAEDAGEAMAFGVSSTRNSIVDIYLTLRNLFTGDLSVRELRGPLGIAGIAVEVAQQGLAELLMFLGFLSVNLAVLNFLPIPVLDGGHMVFLIWEGVTRKKPNERVMTTAIYIGILFILTLMVTVIYLDIARMVTGG